MSLSSTHSVATPLSLTTLSTANVSGDSSHPQPLIRPEVMEAHSAQWLGAVRLTQPIAGWLVAGTVVLICFCFAAFVSLGSVTKKTRVAGVTVPNTGSLSILAPNAGVLSRNRAAEGQHVGAGQPLFELSMEHQGNSGELTALVAQQLAIRKQTLESEQRLRIAQDADKRRALDEHLRNLKAEGDQLSQEIELGQRRLGLAKKSLEQYESLQASGFVSAAQTQQKQEDMIDLESHLSSLARAKVQLQATRLGLEADQKALVGLLATDLAQLQLAEANLNQEIAENQSRKSSVIVAPQAGVLTAITYQPGQTVNAGQSLATFIPDSTGDSGRNNLEVQLYAPSRAVGFVRPGQSVKIRFQAFPYQKFGLQDGLVVDVSDTPFASNELPVNLAGDILGGAQSSGEGLYRVRVKLLRQTILAYGQEQAIRPGMTLDADIVQDRRRIWEWFAEPILAFTHR